MKKSKTKFSSIACDQAYEQTNKLVSLDSVMCSTRRIRGFFRKLENIIPEIHCYHETLSNFVKSYINDIRMVRGRVSINPFLERGARKVNSTMSMPACPEHHNEDKPVEVTKECREVPVNPLTLLSSAIW